MNNIFISLAKGIQYFLFSACWDGDNFFGIECKTNLGEIVKSLKEKQIADYFSENGIKYNYEKPIYINNSTVYPDFFLPEYNLYIEYFGLTNQKRYSRNMRFKMFQYYNNTQGFKFIPLFQGDLKNIDEIFRKKFYKTFGYNIITKLDKICPNCKQKLVKRNGKFGPFYGCSSYPKCKHIENIETIKIKTAKEVGDILSNKLEHFKNKTGFEILEIMSAETFVTILKEKPKSKFQLFEIWGNFKKVQIYGDILIRYTKDF